MSARVFAVLALVLAALLAGGCGSDDPSGDSKRESSKPKTEATDTSGDEEEADTEEASDEASTTDEVPAPEDIEYADWVAAYVAFNDAFAKSEDCLDDDAKTIDSACMAPVVEEMDAAAAHYAAYSTAVGEFFAGADSDTVSKGCTAFIAGVVESANTLPSIVTQFGTAVDAYDQAEDQPAAFGDVLQVLQAMVDAMEAGTITEDEITSNCDAE